MSGGEFNYVQFDINNVADEIEEIIEFNDVKDKNGYMYGYTQSTIKVFQKAVSLLREASTYVHRIDYLVSGDDDEFDFHEKLKKELNILNGQQS